jgi:hypothetical protein
MFVFHVSDPSDIAQSKVAQAVKLLDMYAGAAHLVGTLTFLVKGFRGFSQSLQANAGMAS